MRPFNVTLVCLTGILIGFLAIAGCTGTSDILDENGERYTKSITFQDGEDDTLQIDIVRDFDCDDDGNFTDPEDFFDVNAVITVTAEAGAPGLTLIGYTVMYVPVESSDSNGVLRLPPELTDLVNQQGDNSVTIPSGTSVTFSTTCMRIDSKNELLNDLNADPATYGALVVPRYTIIMTLIFEDEFGEERTLVFERTLNFSGYDRC